MQSIFYKRWFYTFFVSALAGLLFGPSLYAAEHGQFINLPRLSLSEGLSQKLAEAKQKDTEEKLAAIKRRPFNRDGCREVGQGCKCSNTGRKGLCFPSLFSRQQELYCDCSSDVLDERETILLMVKNYDLNKKIRTDMNQVYPDMVLVFDELAAYMNFNGKHPKKKFVQERVDALIKRVADKLAATSEAYKPLAPFVIRTDDLCNYYGQTCKCMNTGAEGMCAVDRSDPRGVLYCHCGG